MTLKIHFQVFKAGLEELLIDIRNHKSVRPFMTDTREIAMQDHLQWVDRNLDPDNHDQGKTQLAFIMLNDKPRGFVLVRDIKQDSGEVGIMIRDSHEVLGLGAVAAVLALEKLCFSRLRLTSVYAKASPHNTKVLGLLRGLGGEETHSPDDRHLWFSCRAKNCRSNNLYQRILTRYRDQGRLVI